MDRRASLLDALPNELISEQNATRRLQEANRVLVIGCSGGGKSTLAKKLSIALGLSYYSMDREVFWLPGWKKRDRSSQRQILSKIVAQDSWIIDGTGKSNFDIRLPRTDIIVWIHLPRWHCLLSVYWRVFWSIGKVRPELADGCPEKWPDKEFIRYIWKFESQHLPGVVTEIAKYGPKIPLIWLTARSDVNKLIDQLGQIA